GVTVDRLVDGIVDDLPEQVVVAVTIGAADVHGGALANRLEALEDLDALGAVLVAGCGTRGRDGSGSHAQLVRSGEKVGAASGGRTRRTSASRLTIAVPRLARDPITSESLNSRSLPLSVSALKRSTSSGAIRAPTRRSPSATSITIAPLPAPASAGISSTATASACPSPDAQTAMSPLLTGKTA